VNELAGRLAEAAVWFDRALTWGRSANALLMPVIAASHLGLVEARSGKVAAGVARLRQAVADAERMGFRNELPFCLAALAEATLASGDVAAATELAERSRSLGATIEDPTAAVLALLVLGHSLRQSGRKPAARARFRAALEIAEAHHLAQFAARCREALDALSTKGRIDPRAIRPDKVSAT
jgi:tetratricopeptide (TPR) repeat protein